MAAGDIIQIWVGEVKTTPHIVVQDTLKIHIQTISPEIKSTSSVLHYYSVGWFVVGEFSTTGDNLCTEVVPFRAHADWRGGGQLYIAVLDTPYIEMVVPKWEGISRGDEIHGFIGNIEASPYVVVQDILDYHTLHFDKKNFLPGDYSVKYVVVPINGQSSIILPKRQLQFTSSFIVTQEV